jgi:hypothetical protein
MQSGAAFEVGASLARTMELFTGNFGRFVVLALIPLLPLLFVEWERSSGSLSEVQGQVASGVLSFLLNPIATAAILYGAISQMRGETFTIVRSFGVILPRLLAILGVTLCVSFAIAVAAVLFVLPGFIVMCILYVAIPACGVEKLGVFGSMDRSGVLTRGYRWRIFGLFLIATIISIVFSNLATFVGIGRPVNWVINSGLQVVSTGFNGVLVAVIYHNLRVAKENVDVSKIANVFD